MRMTRFLRCVAACEGCRADVEQFPAASGPGRTVLGSERGVTFTAGLTERAVTALG